MEELLIVVVIILVIVCAVIFGLLRGRIFPSHKAPAVKKAMIGGAARFIKTGGDQAELTRASADIQAIATGADDAAKLTNLKTISSNLKILADDSYDIVEAEYLKEDPNIDAIIAAIAEVKTAIVHIAGLKDEFDISSYNGYAGYVTTVDEAADAEEIINDDFKENLENCGKLAAHTAPEKCKEIRALINNVQENIKDKAKSHDLIIAELKSSPPDVPAALTIVQTAVLDGLKKISDKFVAAPFDDIDSDIDKLTNLDAAANAGAKQFYKKFMAEKDPTKKLLDSINAISVDIVTYVDYSTAIGTADTEVSRIEKLFYDDPVANSVAVAKAVTAIDVTAEIAAATADIAKHKDHNAKAAKIFKILPSACENVATPLLNYASMHNAALKSDLAKLNTIDARKTALRKLAATGAAPAFANELGPFIATPDSSTLPIPASAWPVANNADLVTVQSYIEYFESLPVILYNVYSAPTIKNVSVAAKFMAKNNDVETKKILAGSFAPGLSPSDAIKLKVICNFLNAVTGSPKALAFLAEFAKYDFDDVIAMYTADGILDTGNTQTSLNDCDNTIKSITDNRAAGLAGEAIAKAESVLNISYTKKNFVTNYMVGITKQTTDIINKYAEFKKIVDNTGTIFAPAVDAAVVETPLVFSDGVRFPTIGHNITFDCRNTVATIGPEFKRISDKIGPEIYDPAADALDKTTKMGALADTEIGVVETAMTTDAGDFNLAKTTADFDKCRLDRTPIAGPPANVLEWFNGYNKVFENLPSAVEHILDKTATYYNFDVAGDYFEYIDSLAGDINFGAYISGEIPEGAGIEDGLNYRIIFNCINAAKAQPHWDIAKAIHAHGSIVKVIQGLYAAPDALLKVPLPGPTAAHTMPELAAIANSDGKKFTEADANTRQLKIDGDAQFTTADAQVYLGDLADKTNILARTIDTYNAHGYAKFLADADTLYADFVDVRHATLAVAVVSAPVALYVEEDIVFGADKLQFIKIGILPTFDADTLVKLVYELDQAKRDSDLLAPEIDRAIVPQKDIADEQDVHLATLRAKISAMAKNIMSALKAEFVESAERIEATKRDLEESDRRERARKQKAAEEAQKLADDEYNARVDALAQIPDETLADRVARIPAEYSNVIHYAMAKRIVKLTGDTSYDISAAEMGNTSLVRDKLVKFFTAQGVKDVTRDNINRKYAEWQKKNTARLVHQSDIDNPSGVILELA